jgi:hypothetical protein
MSKIMALIPVLTRGLAARRLKSLKEFNTLYCPNLYAENWDYCEGSGRFYGAARNDGFIQEAGHPGNDRHVR